MSHPEDASDAIRQGAGWITRQRWYGDKARALFSIEPETVIPVDAGALQATLVIARMRYDSGPDSRYFIPLVADVGASNGTMTPTGFRDALAEPAFLTWLLSGLDEQRVIEGEGDWRWIALEGDRSFLGSLDIANARVLSAEQSNTTVVFDNRVVGKVFRRLQTGRNPDLEVGAFLSRHGVFSHAPRLFGMVEIDHGDDITAVAAIQQFVPNQGDGWEWMLGELGRLTAESRESSLAAVALLGQRTGELHVALASDPDDPDFAPVPVEERDAQELKQRIIAEIGESVEGLAKRVSPEELAALHSGMGRVMAEANTLIGTYKIRVHGDYHLGQTLRTLDHDFCIIDFEGEPSRSIEQRREKQSALKDVAGMLRSLDYAVATVAGRAASQEGWDALSAWLSDAHRVFTEAYRAAASRSAQPLVPADDDRFAEALRLLIAEKTLYEVRYELNNRPDWLPIPLNALRRLAGVTEAGAQYT